MNKVELSFSHFDYNENLDQQRELFKDCFPETTGDTIQTEEHYLWKFHSFPAEHKSWEYISHIEDDLVGYYAAIPYKYKIGDKETSVAMVCDVMTSSKHRGKGIFTKMGDYSTRELAHDVPFSMGYPIRKEVIPGHLKVGWNIPFSLPLYMKFIRFNSLFKGKNIGFLARPANIFLSLYNFLVKTKSTANFSYSLDTNIDNIVDYDLFVKEWIKSVPNALQKDADFARWRYNAPKREYTFLSVRLAGKLVAFVSFRHIIKEGVPSYGILDYMVLPDYDSSHGFINKVLVSCARKNNVEAIMVMMSSFSATKYKLLKNGYIKSPFVFQLIIKNLTRKFSDEQLFNEKNWHLMWVDSDDL